ncbi:MAG: MBL fold metallo-hydrolase [Calditrichaeota bacterium]|nr:MBL fold metallo-hydrolase [Calditrichota bacterium]
MFVSSDNLSQFGAKPTDEKREQMKKSSIYDGKIFKNTVETNVGPHGGFWDMMGRWLFGKELREPKGDIPVVPLTRESFDTPPPEGLRVTWMGHSTVLIEIGGKRILTDPVWSKRCSPFSFAGPARFFDPPIALANLPKIDVVLISHDHYDHLDKMVVTVLAKTGVQFYVPLGVGAHLEKWGIDKSQITEADWWDVVGGPDENLQFTSAPVRHFSGRSMTGRNGTLWTSWVISNGKHNVYFSGDTGPFPGFGEIGEKFGPFDLTLIKIGSYDKGWPDVHLNPEQAVEANIALKGKVMMPIHHSTFNLAFHDWFEPPEWVLKEAKKKSVRLMMPIAGEMVVPETAPEPTRWWMEVDKN